jgi:hypothetical protein
MTRFGHDPIKNVRVMTGQKRNFAHGPELESVTRVNETPTLITGRFCPIF